MDSEIPWKIINKYFEDNPNILVSHNLGSYNDFMSNGIKKIIQERNPIVLQKEQDPKTNEFKYRCELYIGGKNGDRLYYGKPVIYDDNRSHYMYPNEARLRNMTYGVTIHYDVDVEFIIRDFENKPIRETIVLEKIFLGRFPIMLQSELCILNGLNPNVRFAMGECRNDYGGYFIIDGKEKSIISQEKFADNLIYIKENDGEDVIYSHSAKIRTVSEDASKPERTLSVHIVSPSSKYSNKQIVVEIPNVRKPVPLFILMRALGVISDKDIIEYCLLDLDKNSELVDLFIPSVHDANKIFSQEEALKFIGTYTKGKTVSTVHDILMNYFLPQIGELNYTEKAYYLGYIVYKLLLVYVKLEKPTDRDSFKFKRVDMPGRLLYDLFKEYYALQQQTIRRLIDTEYNLKKSIYINNFQGLIQLNYQEYFKERIVEIGFKKAFKGNWGAAEHTKKIGIVQDLNRLSYNSFLSQLRKINLPMDASAKVVKPRLLHGSQWGIIDPVDTPDGANCGLHKHMAITTTITTGLSGYPITKWLRDVIGMKLLEECSRKFLYESTKVFVNGNWVGVVNNPETVELEIKTFRRFALIPIFISCHWEHQNNEIHIFTDGGRLCRPIFYYDHSKKKYAFDNAGLLNKIKENDFSWDNLISGFENKKVEDYSIKNSDIYSSKELYGIENINELFKNKQPAIIEYIDTAEEESALITFSVENEERDKPYTHVEIHPSLLLGIMGNQIAFPDNNPLPRDAFACGQAKQAVSLYNTNFISRIDKMGVILNYGQIPLVKSRYLKYINNEQHPCGENVIVAIMCYSGYNVEDSILFNEASIKRGMFRTTYYNMYEAREESSKVKGNMVDSHFANIEKEPNVVGLKPGYDYSLLDRYGMIKENTELNDKTVVIGKVTLSVSNPNKSVDSSVFPKKGQLGFVDKTFITENEEGFRLAKVRIREERMPSIGDKFCSRCGQKGTVGLIIPEENMPFTEDGIRPDIIINPHALPSRMTIGQLIETLMGKACNFYGGFGDCTAFMNKGDKHKMFGDMLTNVGYHSSGTQVLYNGMTGEQIEANVYIGPTYYMRLKHMVKDKINYRARGPRTLLTRQTVQGRANDGGLRIGEMERDGIIAHGISKFLQESMLVRGDEYLMAVCNKTGTIAIYNSDLDLFLSPMADGPIKFEGTLGNEMNIMNVSKYGRSFSLVRIPYALKLLMQELLTMNISMRIITEDNIDQVTNMNYSNNINKLLFNKDETIDMIIENNKKTIVARNSKTQAENERIAESKKPQDNKAGIILNNEKAEIELMKKIENLGWKLQSKSDTSQYTFVSLILDNTGQPTEVWEGPKEGYGNFPNTHPVGWNEKTLFYSDGTIIPDEVMVETLINNQTPNNWTSSLVKIYDSKFKEGTGQPGMNLISQGYISSPEYTSALSTPIQVSPFESIETLKTISPLGQSMTSTPGLVSPVGQITPLPVVSPNITQYIDKKYIDSQGNIIPQKPIYIPSGSSSPFQTIVPLSPAGSVISPGIVQQAYSPSPSPYSPIGYISSPEYTSAFSPQVAPPVEESKEKSSILNVEEEKETSKTEEGSSGEKKVITITQ